MSTTRISASPGIEEDDFIFTQGVAGHVRLIILGLVLHLVRVLIALFG
jgi:hypothetical protein